MREQLAPVDARARAAGRTGAASGAPASRRRVTARFSRSTTSSPSSITGSPAGVVAAQHRAQAGEQLVDADRLRHVVVGAGVERRDLLPLLADRREHDHRCRAPGAQLTADVDAGPVGQHEIEDHRLGRPHRRRGERRLRRVGRLDLVAGAAQARPQRAQDLLLVVDDEDARRRSAGTSAGATTGSASTNVAPCPSRDSAQTRPPFASAKPRAIASPSPAPRPSPLRAPRWKGSKIRSRSRGATRRAHGRSRARAPPAASR